MSRAHRQGEPDAGISPGAADAAATRSVTRAETRRRRRLWKLIVPGFIVLYIAMIPLNIVMVGLFLLLSPLAPARFSLSGTVQSLPIVGIPFRALKRRQLSQQPQQASRVWLVYDGECPMCNNYAQFLRLRQSVEEFVLVDARRGGPIVDEVRRLPHDLNDGMVVKIGDRHFVGSEALNVLALLSTDRGAFNKFNRLAFSSPLISRVTYPTLKAGRWVLLKLKRVKPIGNAG